MSSSKSAFIKELEDRLIQFSIITLTVSENLDSVFTSQNLADQLSRSCTSPSLNYGEAQVAESRRDFIHKMKIVLKELKETQVCLKIIEGKNYCKKKELLKELQIENDELISIFVSSIKTARKNS